MNDTGDVFSPEQKIKHFLDSLAYFLLLGSTEGIETYYRKVMHAKREIPVSSCPSTVENALYSTGCLSGIPAKEEQMMFDEMLDKLDEWAAPYEMKKPAVKRKPSMFAKKRKLGIHDGEWCRVDTEGKFWVGNNHYVIDDQELQYQPVETEYGDYYAMDRILAANGKFYDMNYNEVKVLAIGGIVSYENFTVGTET